MQNTTKHGFASAIFFDDTFDSEGAYSTSQVPDRDGLGTQMYATDQQLAYDDSDHAYDWSAAFDEPGVSPTCFSADLYDWDMTIAACSAMEASNAHEPNPQTATSLPNHKQSGPEDYRIQYSRYGNSEEDTIGLNEDHLQQVSAAIDSDNPCSQAGAPAQDTTASTNLIRCWLHGCGGRSFTHLSNYRRHCREKSKSKVDFSCFRCGKHFTRKAAWKTHGEQQRCRFIDYDANGVPFERKHCSSGSMHEDGSAEIALHQTLI